MARDDVLPRLSMEIEAEHLNFLERNVWHEVPLPFRLSSDHTFYDAGFTYRGNHTRKFPKKSYRIEFETYNEKFAAREIHLNAEFCDPSLIRNKLSFDFFKKIGSISPDCRHVFLEVNEKPAGIYLQIEAVDDSFLKKRKLPRGPIHYATNHQANFSLLTTKGKLKDTLNSGYFRKLGNEADDEKLAGLIEKINTLPRNEFGREITKVLDVNKYLTWLCGAICTHNYDGFIQNYALYRNGDSGLYEIIPWDYDATFGRNWNGKTMAYDKVPIEGFNTLTARLLDVPAIRHQYRLMLEEILETHFTVAEMEPMIKKLHSKLRPSLSLDPFKKNAAGFFDHEPEFILQFIKDRSQYLKDHLGDLA